MWRRRSAPSADRGGVGGAVEPPGRSGAAVGAPGGAQAPSASLNALTSVADSLITLAMRASLKSRRKAPGMSSRSACSAGKSSLCRAINTATARMSLRSAISGSLRSCSSCSPTAWAMASENSQFSRIALPIEGCHCSRISSSTEEFANSSGWAAARVSTYSFPMLCIMPVSIASSGLMRERVQALART